MLSVTLDWKATDFGKSKVKIESTIKSENTERREVKDQSEVTTESKGVLGLKCLGVKSVDIVPGSCQ